MSLCFQLIRINCISITSKYLSQNEVFSVQIYFGIGVYEGSLFWTLYILSIKNYFQTLIIEYFLKFVLTTKMNVNFRFEVGNTDRQYWESQLSCLFPEADSAGTIDLMRWSNSESQGQDLRLVGNFPVHNFVISLMKMLM